MRSRPILVTGMPRSGTTWVARQLASSRGAALTGREPMNARDGQYALGGTLDGWTRLTDPSTRQQRILRRSYRGLNPWVYGRYGHRQWAAALPWTRVIVKDPFALLSLQPIGRETGALPVLVYRHPGAVLASFRRMGWTPNPGELQRLETITELEPDPEFEVVGAVRRGSASDLELIARMWNVLHRVALDDLADIPEHVIVSHQELAGGGDDALSVLRGVCGLDGGGSSASDGGHPAPDVERLHNLDRDPRKVADAWRDQLDSDEIEEIELSTLTIASRLSSRSLDVRRSES